jgi:hypothetical protein
MERGRESGMERGRDRGRKRERYGGRGRERERKTGEGERERETFLSSTLNKRATDSFPDLESVKRLKFLYQNH